MNKGEKSTLNEWRIKVEEIRNEIESLQGTLEERIENILETFPEGNPTTEKLQEEIDSLADIYSSLDDAITSMEELI